MSERNDTPGHDALREMCAAHALGALDPPDSGRMEAHLATGCDACRAEVESHRLAVAALAGLSPALRPPHGAEDRLLERVSRATAPAPDPAGARRPATAAGTWIWRWLPAAAAIVIAVPALWLAFHPPGSGFTFPHEGTTFEVTTDPLTKIYDLESLTLAHGARCRAALDTRTAIFRVFLHDLEPAPGKGRYHGWLQTESGLRDLGSFVPNEEGHGYAEAQLDRLPGKVEVRITLEPEGAPAGPNGPIILVYPPETR